MEYSKGDLELLGEVTDQIGTILSLSNLVSKQGDVVRAPEAGSEITARELRSATGELLDSISVNPDDEFIRMVEEALRHLPDAIALGQSALAEKMPIRAESHIERGKRLQEILTNSIESLKPAERRPPEPLPRVWYNHAVLYDAYVEGVPNREIMARLYISEGTFHRTRRNAIRGLARLLVEQNLNRQN
jgi:DNA-binding NarL/FixJ family response regulator